MNLYIVTRFGNPHELDGPDGKDTNFIVRAESLEEAAYLVDKVLATMRVHIKPNRKVHDFANCIIQIGIDPLAKEAGILHGPWIEYIYLESSYQEVWHRHRKRGKWEEMSQHFASESSAD